VEGAAPWPRVAATAILLAWAACSGRGDDRFTERHHGSLEYKLFVPKRRTSSLPLVVVLHGCFQDPDEAAAYTRFNPGAEERGLLVMYPRQVAERNQHRCWNWFQPDHQRRGRGEPALLVGAVEQVVREHHVDRARIFVTGWSAGAGMSAVLGACYPDVFAAIGLHSGAGYQGGLDLATAMAALEGPATDPERQGDRAHRCAGAAARVLPVIAIHGGQDRVVAPANAEHAIRHFAQANDLADDGLDNDSIAASAPEVEEVAPPDVLAHRILRTRVAGRPLLVRYEIPGLGHQWSGSSYGPKPRGPDATRILLDFFAANPLGPDR
jgi:poly(hydroxyalkanoate) depolymerase family esterase